MYIIYLIITILTIIFSSVYLKLSFGVVSYFMKYIFVIPLVLGVIVYFILDKLKFVQSDRLSFNLYNAAIFTLIVGAGIQGILEICGAESKYTPIYLIISIIFIIITLINVVVKSILFNRNNRKEA